MTVFLFPMPVCYLCPLRFIWSLTSKFGSSKCSKRLSISIQPANLSFPNKARNRFKIHLKVIMVRGMRNRWVSRGNAHPHYNSPHETQPCTHKRTQGTHTRTQKGSTRKSTPVWKLFNMTVSRLKNLKKKWLLIIIGQAQTCPQSGSAKEVVIVASSDEEL